MGLLLDAANEGKEGLVLLQADLLPLPVHQGPGAVSVVLDHAEDGDAEAQLLQRRSRRPHLSHAAIHEQHVGHLPELLVPVQIPPEAAGDDLFHGGVVVGVLQPLEGEVAVVPFQGSAVHVHRHGGHNVCVSAVGDVKGLHAVGGLGQAQQPPQSLHQFGGALLGGGGPLYLLGGVLVGHGHQLGFGPSLGGEQLHLPAHRLGEHPGQLHLAVKVQGEENLPGQGLAALVILGGQRGHALPLVLLHGQGQQLPVLGRQLPVHIVEHHKTALGLSPVVAHHVGVRQRAHHRLLPLGQQLHRPNPVPVLGGLFKAQVLGGLLHLSGPLRHHLVQLALQQLHRLVHVGPVLALVHIGAAIAVTGAHVEVEAGALLADVPGELPLAGGQAQGGEQGVNDALAGPPGAVGAEVPGPVPGHLGGKGELGILLLDAEADIGVALAVLEQNVVPGLVALDEGALQHQGLELRGHHNDVKVVDLGDHGPGLFIVAALVLEILAHPVFQRLGLAHVDHFTGGVLHDIHPRL